MCAQIVGRVICRHWRPTLHCVGWSCYVFFTTVLVTVIQGSMTLMQKLPSKSNQTTRCNTRVSRDHHTGSVRSCIRGPSGLSINQSQVPSKSNLGMVKTVQNQLSYATTKIRFAILPTTGDLDTDSEKLITIAQDALYFPSSNFADRCTADRYNLKLFSNLPIVLADDSKIC